MAYQDRVIRPLGLTAILQGDPILDLYKGIKSKTGGRKLLEGLADDYLNFVHRRHLQNSSGGQGWPALSRVTVSLRRSKRRVSKPIRGLKTILIDQGQLLGATAKGGRGQVRKLDVANMTVRAGVDGTTVYHDPRKGTLGKRSRRTLGQLVNYHRTAQGVNNKRREIIVPPDKSVIDNFQHNARNWIQSLTTNAN